MSLNLDRLQAQDKYWEGGKPTLQMQLFWQKFAKAIEDAFNSNEALDATQQQLIEDVQTALTAALGASNDLGVTNDFIRTRDSAVSGLTLDADTSSITVSTHDRQYLDPSQTVSVTGDTITGLSSSTTYYVHYTDEDYSGGTVGYQVATALADAVPSPTEPYRHYVGTIEVPAVGTATGTAAPDPYWKVTSVGGGGGGTTTNAVTFNNGGSGDASGTTFDGSAARTVSYNTVGAAASGHNHSGVYEPADADLTALAGVSSNGLLARTGAGTAAARTITAGTGISVTNGDGVAGNPTIARASGTSFPGSPSTGDIFWRSDRLIEYVYDGTRWLSTQQFSHAFVDYGTTQSATFDISCGHPFVNKGYSIYIETFQAMIRLTNGTTASNYFVAQLNSFDSGTSTTTAYGSGLSSQNATTNAFVSYSEAINSTVASTEELIFVRASETGTATARVSASFTYRLVG